MVQKILYQGRSCSKNIDIANAMNEHFCTIGETLQKNLPNCNYDDFKEFLPPPRLNSFSLSPIITEEINV